MPRFIIKLTDEEFDKEYYLEWSTVVDAPVTWGYSLDEFKEYYLSEYGRSGMRDLDKLLQRVEDNGISADYPFNDLNILFDYNRAGQNNTYLNKQQVIDRYCRNRL